MEGYTRPRVGVAVWQGRGWVLGAEGLWGATWGSGLGVTFTRPEGAIPFFFFFGVDTCLYAICFPNTTRASLSCLLVPQIKMRYSEGPSTSWVKAETQALNISVTCFRPWLLHPTTCPIRSSAMTKEVEKWSGKNSLGWWAERGAATDLLVVAREQGVGRRQEQPHWVVVWAIRMPWAVWTLVGGEMPYLTRSILKDLAIASRWVT